MKRPMPRTAICLSSLLLALAALPDWASAQPARGGGAYGDWLVKIDFDGRQMESVLAFSRGQDGNRTGQWISFMGVSDLQDLEYDAGQLSFSWSRSNRDGQTMTSKFAGTIQDGILSGKLSSDRGTFPVEGKRSPRVPRAAGNWEMTLKMNDREFTSTLMITSDATGDLSGRWESEWGEHTISDLAYERGNLTFSRRSKMQDREWDSTFAGTIEGNTLTGTVKSERGELAVTGERLGGALIGTWNLEATSERGARKQRLRVNPDMSGLYGSLSVDKINLAGNQVSFKTSLQFGDQEFEMNFAGQVDGSEMTGELTTSRGSQKITGTKVPRRSRPRMTN